MKVAAFGNPSPEGQKIILIPWDIQDATQAYGVCDAFIGRTYIHVAASNGLSLQSPDTCDRSILYRLIGLEGITSIRDV